MSPGFRLAFPTEIDENVEVAVRRVATLPRSYGYGSIRSTDGTRSMARSNEATCPIPVTSAHATR